MAFGLLACTLDQKNNQAATVTAQNPIWNTYTKGGKNMKIIWILQGNGKVVEEVSGRVLKPAGLH